MPITVNFVRGGIQDTEIRDTLKMTTLDKHQVLKDKYEHLESIDNAIKNLEIRIEKDTEMLVALRKDRVSNRNSYAADLEDLVRWDKIARDKLSNET